MVHSSGRDALPGSSDETEQRSRSARWMYRLIAFISVLFIFTIFVMIAVTMSDPTIPANQAMNDWLNQYAASILITQVVVIGLLVMCAFVVDRRESWQRYHREYAQWEIRMQQLSEQNATAPPITPESNSDSSSGDAE